MWPVVCIGAAWLTSSSCCCGPAIWPVPESGAGKYMRQLDVMFVRAFILLAFVAFVGEAIAANL